MSFTYGFYDSVNGDRTYSADQFGSMFDGLVSDGVFQYVGSHFLVSPSATAGYITVAGGKAWFEHTWTISDSAIDLELGVPDESYDRIDLICLKVDAANRTNSLAVIAGSPDETPTVPSVPTHHLALATIYVSADSGPHVFLSGDITNLPGTTGYPYASYAIPVTTDIATVSSKMHRCTFRGNNLGTSFTSAQKDAINSGVFTDIFLGDYWRFYIGAKTLTWRIADIDYFYGKGGIDKHHILLIPDECWYNRPMNASNTTSGAFYGSAMLTYLIEEARDVFSGYFSSSELYAHTEYLTSAMTNGKPTAVTSTTATTLLIPSEAMIFGHPIHNVATAGDSSNGSINGFSVLDTTQLKLFDVAPQYINLPTPGTNDGYWLRDPVGTDCFAYVNSEGAPRLRTASTSCGVRPILVLKGA